MSKLNLGLLTSSEKLELLTLLEARDAREHIAAIRGSFKAWCIEALKPVGQVPALHHELMIRELEAVERGETRKLMLLLPPGSAKTTYGSYLYPAWHMARNPHSRIVAASHTTDRAEYVSLQTQRYIRDNADALGYHLTKESVGRWSTSNDSEYLAAGVRMKIAGFRGTVGIVDDPVSGRDSADSASQQEKIWDWYWSDFFTRLVPGAKQILIMTRWSINDLGGKLEASEGDEWKIVRLPAVAEGNDPLGRAPGDWLWSDDEYGFGEKLKADYASFMKNGRQRDWNSLYLQRPTSSEGSILLRKYWKPWTDPVPDKPVMVVMSLDTAYTENSTNDPSAFTIMHVVDTPYRPQPIKLGAIAETPDMRVKVLVRYAWHDWLEFPKLIETIIDAVKTFRIPGVPFRLLVEDKASGLSVLQEMRRRMPGLGLHVAKGVGSKVTRAHSVTEIMQAGRVYALARLTDDEPEFAKWATTLIEECAAFPLGAHDDLADCFCHSLRHIRDLGVELFPEDMPAQPDSVERAALY